MADVLREHWLFSDIWPPRCFTCGDIQERSDAEHKATALSAAGFGPVEKAAAPEVRHVTLENGDAELDEVVARNATVHLEAMADNHWWLLVESGGQSVHVNFYTKRAKIRGHAEPE